MNLCRHSLALSILRVTSAIAATMALGVGLPAVALAATSLPGPVVSVQWLHDHASDVQIVDIRDDLNSLMEKPRYQMVRGKRQLDQVGGFIPDALSVNFWALRESREIKGKKVDLLMPTATEFQAIMRASVLEGGKPVVLVPTGDDATSLQEASFLAWQLQVFGMPAGDIAILDGGTHAWISAGFEVEIDAIAPLESGHWQASEPSAELLATMADTQQTQMQHKALWDARPLAQFAGVDKTPAISVKARLEGSRSLPAEILYAPDEDGAWRFLKPEQYKAVMALQGMPKMAPGILYCNTGQYAAGAWFIVSRIMGRDGFRLYPGGMNEWTQNGLPVKKTFD